MDLPAYRVRRAVIDDLPELQALWTAMHLSASELEKRLTEFQVAESGEGVLLGALGMEISGRQGRIHSESFLDFALADELRLHLWERLQSLATNHGLMRLWTRETAPFWNHNGFHPATPEALKKLPAAWAADASGWVTLKLRDEEAVEMALEKDFTRFKLEEQQRTEKIRSRARILNFIGVVLAVLLFVVVGTFAVMWVLRNYPHFLGR